LRLKNASLLRRGFTPRTPQKKITREIRKQDGGFRQSGKVKRKKKFRAKKEKGKERVLKASKQPKHISLFKKGQNALK